VGHPRPELGAVAFQYDASRSTQAAGLLLGEFTGLLQCDGYEVYESWSRNRPVELVFCMAHARRYFIEASDSDPPRASWFLERVRRLYAIERRARESRLDHDQRLALRQQEAVPILEEIREWLVEQHADRRLIPKSPIRKAVDYALRRWQGLSRYARDGRLEIDNNLIENTIRPIALGRKNYLFAGSHETAQNLACLYAILGTCDKHGLNAHAYLTWLLRQVATRKVTDEAVNWLPHRLNPEMKQTFAI